MEIRDVIHGAIEVDPNELEIVDSHYFQRLRQIKQLGFSEFSFPGATHNRYIHSLGAMATATHVFESIFQKNLGREAPHTFYRFRAVVRLAALLHDVGHGPLSHTTEFAMPQVEKLGLVGRSGRKATHEDYTLKIILASSLTPVIERGSKPFGITPDHIASLVDPTIEVKDDFFKEKFHGETIDFQPILQQMISSELDADRMDYLRRDSHYAGVSYGEFDFDWLASNLTYHLKDGRCFLALQHRALYSFEDFLISRFHMFLMVYFHYKAVIFDEMLAQYLEGPECTYSLPSDIEDYATVNDAHLHTHLSSSKNPWARRIADKKPYRVLLELHSGIPATETALKRQEKLLTDLKAKLDEMKIHYLTARATGELSKYFRKPGTPIYVRYDNHFNATSFIPLQECTDLFQRYNEKRSITRLYVAPEDYAKCQTLALKEQPLY